MSPLQYDSFKAQAMEHAREEAKRAFTFATIGKQPEGFTPAQVVALAPVIEHYASLGARAALGHAVAHGHITVR